MLKDITIVLADIEYENVNGEVRSHPVTYVFRFDFNGSVEDLKEIFDKNERLFIEGGQMMNT